MLVDLPQSVQADSPSYPGIRNELSDYISRNNSDALIGERSEALVKEAFHRYGRPAATVYAHCWNPLGIKSNRGSVSI